ncbi:MAG: nucleoside deaminase [Bacteroidales bacterium]|nr:nucleoside deaminase [Candidatus Equimonas enterica]
MKTPQEYIRMATQLAMENIDHGGGPFGAVIVKDGKVIATGVNRVTPDHDPTAHAEVQAIRAACQALGTFSLEGCAIYASCEPCPMCLGAIYWARISHLYYGCTQQDADKIDFSDAFIYKEIALPQSERALPHINVGREEALAAFEKWKNKEDKIAY